MKKLLLAALCVAATLSASAQGTVNFANIGGGVNAPVSGPDGLLGAGFTAQLQLGDGTNIGDPAPFLANGLFSGGSRTVAGVAGGANATLQVFVSNADGSISGTSGQVTVTLANPNAVPVPETPAALAGLSAFNAAGGAVVPEPSTIALALLGGAALLLRRRK
ncbi:PEP-CTERM sorting domain-containing protein [bacterium]|nr:PEP-CTERM sorting domain-containing protein [bacterium]